MVKIHACDWKGYANRQRSFGHHVIKFLRSDLNCIMLGLEGRGRGVGAMEIRFGQ